jgi:hypothetical protein
LPGAKREVGAVRWIVPPIACLTLLVSGCSSDTESTLRQHATERTVTRFVAKHTGYRPTDMSCPSGVPAEVGTRLQCHFTGPDGPYTAYVRVLRVEGERVIDHIVTRPTRGGKPS